MPAKRIIACLDVKDGRVVKGVRFVQLRDAGDPAELAAAYSSAGIDEVVFLDITASAEKRGLLVETVERAARQVFIPLAVGGGVRTVEDGRRLLRAGADKVSVNTAAVERPELIFELSQEFGAQAVVLAIDARRVKEEESGGWPVASERQPSLPPRPGQRAPNVEQVRQASWPVEPKWQVFTYGGRKPVDMDAIEWAFEGEHRGAGEILLTSMDRDGTKAGFDCELTRAVSRAVRIPVIASGGGGTPEHFWQVLTEGEADAALAASIFHYGEIPVAELKRYLAERAVDVRIQ
jgi:cyclase